MLPDKKKQEDTIEAEISHPVLRIVVASVFLVIAIGAITYGIMGLVNGDAGWNEIEVTGSDSDTSAMDFVFKYDVPRSFAGSEKSRITNAYNNAARRAYRILSSEKTYEGVTNLHDVNENVNREIEIEPELYELLLLFEKYGRRDCFLAPVFSQYEGIFRSFDDDEAALFDPFLNEEAAAFVDEVAGYARDESKISLSFLGNNRVVLNVSDDYLEFAERNGIDILIDLYWMRNAFAADLIRSSMVDAGYTDGYLVSIDGFSVFLGETGEEKYSTVLRKREGTVVSDECVLLFSGPVAIVRYSDYTLFNGLNDYYYVYESGDIRNAYIDIDTGRSRCSVSEMIVFSNELGCGELLLKTVSGYISDKVIGTGGADGYGYAYVAEDGQPVFCEEDGNGSVTMALIEKNGY